MNAAHRGGEMRDDVIAQTAQVAAAKAATYGGAGAAFVFGLTVNEFVAFGGLLIAAVGLLLNYLFKRNELAETRRHHKAMETKG